MSLSDMAARRSSRPRTTRLAPVGVTIGASAAIHRHLRPGDGDERILWILPPR